jgi:long-chain acyl-CoA synthetase
VAPEKIENCLIQSLFIGQAFVYGDSFQSSLVAIVVPDEEPIRHMLATKNATLAKAPFTTICQSPELKDILMDEIKRAAKENGLNGFETPRAIHLETAPFSVDNELLTPTFKLKRHQARDRYEKEIEAMYANMPPPKSKL